jgi:hypothetical protein
MCNIMVNRPAVEAGLRVLGAGGGFADGLIAFDGNRPDGATFVSFDRGAVSIRARQGQPGGRASPAPLYAPQRAPPGPA